MLSRITLFVSVLLVLNATKAQQICGVPPDLATACADACVLCDIDGLTSLVTQGTLGTMPPGFCTMFQHGIHYIGFIPQTTDLNLNISVYNCTVGGNGLEMGIYQSTDCVNFTLMSNCNTDMFPNQTWPINSNKPLMPGKVHYLVIDGNGPNTCSFSVNVIMGSTKTEPVVFNGLISGPTVICPGQTGIYMVPPSTGNPCEFFWTLDGVDIGDGKIKDLIITEPGIHKLCVKASNLCFPAEVETCIDILVKEIPITKVGPFVVCEADLPFDFGNDSFFGPGDYEVTFTSFNNCDSVVQFNLGVIPEKINDLGIIPLCSGDSLVVNGIPFFNPGNYVEVFSLNYAPYCDSTVVFQIQVDSVMSIPALIGILGCYVDSVLLNGLKSIPLNQVSYQWFKMDSSILNFIGNNSSISIADTGFFSLVVQHKITGFNKFCTDTAQLKVLRDSIVPSLIIQNLPQYCEQDLVDLNLSMPVDTNNLSGFFTFHDMTPCNLSNQIGNTLNALKDTIVFINYKAGSCEIFMPLYIEVNIQPWANVIALDTICNTSQGGNITVYDFANSVTAGDSIGKWEAITSNNATGNLPILDFNGVALGNYQFSYTTQSATAPCQDVVYNLSLNVKDCKCPFVELLKDQKICNDQLIYDLNGLLVNLDKGNFIIKNKPFGSNSANISNSLLNVFEKDVGIYELLFQLDSVPQTCPNAFLVEFELVESAKAELVQLVSVCGDTTKGPASSQINPKDFFISGDQSGLWTSLDLSGFDVSNPIWDFSGIPFGIYQFQYSLQATSPCLPKSYTIGVEVKNCSCPEFEIIPNMELCQAQGSFDLNSLIVAAPQGSWTLVNTPSGTGQGSLSGSSFVCNNCLPGNYQFQYILQNSLPNCPLFKLTEIEVLAANNAGVASPNLSLCDGQDSTLLLFEQISAYSPGGLWFYVKNFGTSTEKWETKGNVIPAKQFQVGKHHFAYLNQSNPMCPSDTSFWVLEIVKTPDFSLEKDSFISCTNPSIDLSPKVFSISLNTFQWKKNGVLFKNDSTIKIGEAGIYEFTVNSGVCSLSKSIVIKDFNKPIKLSGLDLFDADCKREKGKIKLKQLLGGTMPIKFFLNKVLQNFKDSFDLNTGFHFISISDNYGCKWDTTFMIQKANLPMVKLPEDITLESGENYTIVSELIPLDLNVKSINWRENGAVFECVNCESITVSPLFTSKYRIAVVTSQDCLAGDEMNIVIVKNRRVYIPNAFSPNSDNLNDFFTIFGGANTLKVESFEVFDRWGERVFGATDFIPDGVNGGWDGTFRGKELKSGVFVYFALINFADGSSEFFKGDVQLIR